MKSRRDFLSALAGAVCFANTSGRTQTSLPRPDPSRFQSGDFIWPKRPGEYVPYQYPPRNSESYREDEQRWLEEKNRFLAHVSTAAPHFSAGDIEAIRKLSFPDFLGRYAGDQDRQNPYRFLSGSGVYVGHVAIIEIDASGQRWVVEALFGQGVVRQTYASWLGGRAGEIVWHGRVRGYSEQQRSQIPNEAKKVIGRPYDFWNFDLSDDHNFYCSKLAWLSIYRALRIPIDGNPNPKRNFWFSPKQLLYLNTIERMFDPGPYARSSNERVLFPPK
jgi:hypothetical protein